MWNDFFFSPSFSFIFLMKNMEMSFLLAQRTPYLGDLPLCF